MKKPIYLIIIAFVALSLILTACGPSTDQPSEGETSAEPVEIHFAFPSFNNIPEPSAVEDVEAAINEITVPEINATVKLHPYSIMEYNQQVTLSLQSGEGLDVFVTLGNLPQYVSENRVLDISDMIDEYAPEAKEIVGESFLKTTTLNGKLWGIPAYKGVALAPSLVYRADIMEEIDVDPSTIESVYDLTEVYAKILEQYPEMTPLVPVQTGVSGLIQSIYGIDYLGDDFYSPTGVLVGDSTTVVNFYDTQEFRDMVSLARDWYNSGYILKDAATTNSTSIELMSSGKGFSYIASYSGNDAYTQISAQTGQDIRMVRVAEPYLGTSSVNSLTWAVASTSEHPQEALQFMNMIFADKDVINLVIFGIEGRDYVKVDEDHVQYPEGQDGTSVPYTAQLSCGIVGNQFIQYQMAGTDMEDLELWEYENQNAGRSKAFGFTFDNSSVVNEYAAVQNVIDQYFPGLQTGSLDPETALPEFLEKLEEAGINKIIEAKQEQLDDWLANQ
jgi:putative aldouronate transport system substrate-binding protein